MCDRQSGQILLYDQTRDHGQTLPPVTVLPLDDPALDQALEPGVLEPLREELELLDAAGEEVDPEAVSRGEATPVFFGSALTNFGLDVFFRRFLEMAPAPGPMESNQGPVMPEKDPFSGFIFKVQANMNLRHRDRVAFLKVCSGRFEAGAEATVARTGRTAAPVPTPGASGRRDGPTPTRSWRETWWGSTIGEISESGTRSAWLRVSSTPGSPASPPSTSLRCAWRTTSEESTWTGVSGIWRRKGTILLLFSDSISGPVPIVGAVGRLQFEVLVARLKAEYGVSIRLETLPFHAARWVIGPEEDIRRVSGGYGRKQVVDADGLPMILFETEWVLSRTEGEEKRLQFHDVQPG